ncbi:N-acetylmuramoyl-L-alanine amidase [Candidatus Dependentiae bacterium]|nr:N-acetylmuramoyl-L-alanine amidase [Candidatus Dependentiae bacterium]MCC7415363.1 N-acetylmuramoyl-L-alanine amidase [Campylobacterota bacterium]
MNKNTTFRVIPVKTGTQAFKIMFFLISLQAYAKPYTLMLDPAGDARSTGRLIDDVFERSLTLSCAQQLKQELEENIPGLQVVVTRAAGETIEPLQNAHFANRLGVDFFVRIQVFQEHAARDTISIYTVSWGDECAVRTGDMSFVSYDKAHLKNFDRTKTLASGLHAAYTKLVPGSCIGVFAIPCTPLLGITAPALCIEVGLTVKNSWPLHIKNMNIALTELIRTARV